MALAEFIPTGGGWRPDVPDPRDWRPQDDAVGALLESAGFDLRGCRERKRIDLREWFTPVRGTSDLHDDSVCAVLAAVEWAERRASGSATPRSARFLYHVARRLEGSRGDVGVSLRSTLKALVRFGAPPVAHWPDDRSAVDETPDPFAYGFARECASFRYVRLDDPGDRTGTLRNVRQWLSTELPCVFGFSVPTSLSRHADIPFRPTFDGVRGGAAAVAVGYRDRHRASTVGALRIRSMWGPNWGRRGYGWLPYACVEGGMARDFWGVVGTG